MKIFLDTEFAGLGGELISMALVTEDGREWYEVKIVSNWHLVPEWVMENVIPKLDKEPIHYRNLLRSFCDFIVQFDGAEIIADWPADFEYFSKAMTDIGAADSFVMPIECTMRLVRGDDTIAPVTPHNALSDARALRDWYLRQEPSDVTMSETELVRTDMSRDPWVQADA